MTMTDARRKIMDYAAAKFVPLNGLDIHQAPDGFTICAVDAFAYIDAARDGTLIAAEDRSPRRSSYARMGVRS